MRQDAPGHTWKRSYTHISPRLAPHLLLFRVVLHLFALVWHHVVLILGHFLVALHHFVLLHMFPGHFSFLYWFCINFVAILQLAVGVSGTINQLLFLHESDGVGWL